PWGVWIDAVIMRANDILLAFPALLLAIIFAAVYSPGTGPAMVAVGIAAIPGFARVARSATLQVLGSEYVRAARAANRRTPAIAILLALSAFPPSIISAAVYPPATVPALVAVGIAAIPGFARVARSGTLQVLGSEYVRAARAANRRTPAIAVVHVLPNIAGMVIVQASVAFAISVLAEAGLSFLGLGTQAPVPSWGRMLQESQQFLSTHPELALWPGLFIAL